MLSSLSPGPRGPLAGAALLGTLCLLSVAGCGRSRASAPGAESAASRPVPVVVSAAAHQDVPIYLDGLGSVIAFKTVTVRSQVDGRLDKVLFREGQSVRRGEVLAQVDPRPFESQLHQAEGALARDTALLHDNRLNLERYTSLRKQNLVAQQQVDDQQAQVGQYEGAMRVDQAQIENAKLLIEYARITSPIEGVTGVRLVDEGNLVHATDASGIVVVTQIDPIAVYITLPEDDLHRVMAAMKQGTLEADAYSRDGAKRLGTGQITVIDNQINQATATLRLKAVFPNPDRQLWPNQFVKTRILLLVQKGALVVPAAAVQRGPKGTFVYIVGQDQTAAIRPIEVESLVGEQALLSSGVQAGEQVVIEGQNQLRPGSKVSPRDRSGGPGKGKGAEGRP